MAQNIYDQHEFYDGYIKLDRQVHGLAGALEWPSMRSMIPPVAGKRVVDLGCGFGWMTRWAVTQGASSALGIDLSDRMLGRARDLTDLDEVSYQQSDLDALDLMPDSYDIAVSSLALHYVHDLPRLFQSVATGLTPGGALVFSVEHPIYSAPTQQQFETLTDGRMVWPLDNYLVQGTRRTYWFVDGVLKQHRTIATYINDLVEAGFRIGRLDEWGPSPDQLAERPELAVDLHRPWFLLVVATKSA